MPTDVIMPALGMAQDTGKVVRWLKAEGDSVTKGEPLLEIETDKVTVEVEAPAEGTLAGIRAREGDEVPVGEAVAVVLAAGEALAETEPRLVREVEATVAAAAGDGAAATEPRLRRRLASPKARRLAAEAGVDVDTVAGSGPGGAVLAADVESSRAPAAVPASADETAAAGREPAETQVGSVWKAMAEHTTRSWQAVPHFVLRREIDATRLRSWRAVARGRPGGEQVSYTDLLVKVVAETLRRHAHVNASWRDGGIVAHERVNVAIAIATDDGLVAPVVQDADRLELSELAARRRELVTAARERRLRREDVVNGTFTVSNLGMYGVDSFDAIVNAPQAAILAVGRMVDRVVPIDGSPAVRPMLGLSISFDHRVVDGARGAEFLDTLASLLEEPAGLVR
jgi:pyruvate dehydrogenase E2 component (dihydrolipoamide acetyltransferase)